MASIQHEGLVRLFRNRPMLAPELLRDALKVGLPTFTEARIESAELTEVVPTEYRADLVVLLLEGKPVFAIIVEVQLGRDEVKRKTWPQYLTSLRSRVGCDTALLVVAPDPAVARWCAQPIKMGHPGFILTPLVTGPDAIPIILDAEAACRDPELAVLSAMAHGQEDVGQAIAFAALAGLQGLDADRGRLYQDLVVSSLNDAARTALEKLMQSGTYVYQTDFARKHIAQGHQEGLEKGKQEGRLEGVAIALVKVLEARGLEVHAEARQRIQACPDPTQLETWLGRAVTVGSVEELFEKPPSKGMGSKAAKPGRSTSGRKPRPRR